MALRAMQIPPLFQKKFEPPPRNKILAMPLIRIHSLVQYKTLTVVFDRTECNDFIF